MPHKRSRRSGRRGTKARISDNPWSRHVRTCMCQTSIFTEDPTFTPKVLEDVCYVLANMIQTQQQFSRMQQKNRRCNGAALTLYTEPRAYQDTLLRTINLFEFVLYKVLRRETFLFTHNWYDFAVPFAIFIHFSASVLQKFGIY